MQATKSPLGIKVPLLGLLVPLFKRSWQRSTIIQPLFSRFSRPLSTTASRSLLRFKPLSQISNLSSGLTHKSLMERDVENPSIELEPLNIVNNNEFEVDNTQEFARSNSENSRAQAQFSSLSQTELNILDQSLLNHQTKPKRKAKSKSKAKSISKAKRALVPDAVEGINQSFDAINTTSGSAEEQMKGIEPSPAENLQTPETRVKTRNIQRSHETGDSENNAQILVEPILPTEDKSTEVKNLEDSEQTAIELLPIVVPNSESRDEGDHSSKMPQAVNSIQQQTIDVGQLDAITSPLATSIDATAPPMALPYPEETSVTPHRHIPPLDIQLDKSPTELVESASLSEISPAPDNPPNQPVDGEVDREQDRRAAESVESTPTLPKPLLSVAPVDSTAYPPADGRQTDTTTPPIAASVKEIPPHSPVLPADMQVDGNKPELGDSLLILPKPSPSTAPNSFTQGQKIDGEQINTIASPAALPPTEVEVPTHTHASELNLQLDRSKAELGESTHILPQLPQFPDPDKDTPSQTDNGQINTPPSPIAEPSVKVEVSPPHPISSLDIYPDRDASESVSKPVLLQPSSLVPGNPPSQIVDGKQDKSSAELIESVPALPELLPSVTPVDSTAHPPVDEEQTDTNAPPLAVSVKEVEISPHQKNSEFEITPSATLSRWRNLELREFQAPIESKIQSSSDNDEYKLSLSEIPKSSEFLIPNSVDLPPPQGFAVGGQVATSQTTINQSIAPSDTVPAMLTPGEFVINPKDAQENIELLQHINAGGTVPKDSTLTTSQSPELKEDISPVPTQRSAEATSGGVPVQSQVDEVKPRTAVPQRFEFVDSLRGHSAQRKSSDFSLSTALDSLVSSSPWLETGNELSGFSSLQSNSFDHRVTPHLSQGTTHYSSTPLIFRKPDSRADTPSQWSSIEDLLNGGERAESFDVSTLNFADEETIIAPKGFAAGREVTTSSSTPTVSQPTAKNTEKTESAEDENSSELELLAHEIYNRLRQRLEVERERHGLYSGRLPW